MAKKVLIITYYWPPSGGSGVQRWTYFAKYLARLGYEPIVVTVRPEKATYPSIDESLLKEVEGIRTIRTDSFEPLQVYSKLVSGSKNKAVPYGSVDTRNTSFIKKIPAFIRGNLVLPDARKYWKRYALAAAREILKEEKIDVMVTTGPPHSTHLIGKSLKAEFDVPWLVDFRDPWTEVFYNKDLFRTKWAANKDRKMEVSVLNDADAIVVVSRHMVDLLGSKMKDNKKIKFILNGFDAQLFHEITPSSGEETVISYVGYLGKHHFIDPFTKGLKALCEQQNFEKIYLHLAGNIEASIFSEWEKIPNLVIKYEGIVTHKRALEIMLSADILLISIPESNYAKGIITGKLLECLATGKPILLLSEKDSEAAKIIAEYNNTAIMSEENNGKFIDFFQAVKRRDIAPREMLSGVSQYTRENTTKQLIEILRELER